MLWAISEAVDIKKRWQDYTEELYKRDLNDPENHNGVISHLEPDIQDSYSSLTSQELYDFGQVP